MAAAISVVVLVSTASSYLESELDQSSINRAKKQQQTTTNNKKQQQTTTTNNNKQQQQGSYPCWASINAATASSCLRWKEFLISLHVF
jgi:hypothetical protein